MSTTNTNTNDSQSPTYTYDLNTPLGKLRLLISDTQVETRSCVFADTECQTFLDLAGGLLPYAAAIAFDAMAGDASKLAIKMKNDVTETDPTKLGDSLRAQAKQFRDNPEKVDATILQNLLGASANGGNGFIKSPDRIFSQQYGLDDQEYPTRGNQRTW
jgi:hypothetical protein